MRDNLSYLAGIIDGEGTYYRCKDLNKRGVDVEVQYVEPKLIRKVTTL